MSSPANAPASQPLSARERNLIAAWLKSQSALVPGSGSTIPVRANRDWAPASHGQEQLWLHSRLAGQHLIYNETVTVHYRGSLDVPAFRKSIAAFIRRHEAWRTTFVFEDGALRQKIHPHLEIPVPFNDLSALPENERGRKAIEMARKDALLPFDLSTGPLLRCRLVTLQPDLHRLFLCLHHIIFDGVSLYSIFLTELIAMYRAYAQGAEPQLPLPDIQYGDYAEWHRKWVRSRQIVAQAEYWKSVLVDLPQLDLPSDHPRSKQQSFRGSMEQFFVPQAAMNALREVGQKVNATLFMVLAAVLAVQLKWWTGAEDIPIGSACSGRKWSETERTVGFFVNTTVFRIDASKDPTFTQLVERVRETIIAAMEQDELPFPAVVREVKPRRDAALHPLFQIMFSLQPPLAAVDEAWEFTKMDVEPSATKFDLHLEMDERTDGILARFIYNVDLFERNSMRRMTQQWLRIAAEVTAHPDLPLSQLKMSQLEKRGAGRLLRRLRRLSAILNWSAADSAKSPEKAARRGT